MNSRRKSHWRLCAGVFAGAGILRVLQELAWPDPPLWLTSGFWLAGGFLVAGANLVFAESPPPAKQRLLKTALGVALWVASLSVFVSGPPEAVMPWRPYSAAALAEAGRLGRPVMIDFYATWCEPCQRLDRAVFGRRDVVEAARRFTTLRADVTDQEKPACVEAMKNHRVVVIPTVVFIGSDGVEKDDLRWVGLGSAPEFKRRMAALK